MLDQALSSFVHTCKSASTSLAINSHTQSIPVRVLRNDLLSLSRLIHTSTTRLSIALGKPPPSYSVAIVPLNDLTSYVQKLSSCVSTFPTGALRKEAVWAAEELFQALETLAEHFESQCRRREHFGNEYLAMTGAVHDAVTKVEKLSSNDLEAVEKAWRTTGESLQDSLNELEEMVANGRREDDDDIGDGWDELGEGFGGKLDPDAMGRAKKIYPLLRFTNLLHARILSHHILIPQAPWSHPGHLTSLLLLSESLLPAADDLVSALYAPQDVENIREAAETVHQITNKLRRELDTAVDEETTRKALEQLQVQGNETTKYLSQHTKTQKWFEQCFSQIDIVHDGLDLGGTS